MGLEPRKLYGALPAHARAGTPRERLAGLARRAAPTARAVDAVTLQGPGAHAVPRPVVGARLAAGAHANAVSAGSLAIGRQRGGGRGARHRRGAGCRGRHGAAEADHVRCQGHLARPTRRPDLDGTVEAPVALALSAQDVGVGGHREEEHANERCQNPRWARRDHMTALPPTNGRRRWQTPNFCPVPSSPQADLGRYPAFRFVQPFRVTSEADSSLASTSAAMSSSDQSLSVTPTSMAGVQRSVW